MRSGPHALNDGTVTRDDMKATGYVVDPFVVARFAVVTASAGTRREGAVH